MAKLNKHGGTGSIPKCYLAGPMTGLPNFNEPSFHKGADLLRLAGWFVYNPVENDAEAGIVLEGQEGLEDFDLAEAMKRDLVQVLDSDALFVLPGWEYSTGAEIETWVATRRGINKKVYSLLSGRELSFQSEVTHDFHTPEVTRLISETEKAMKSYTNQQYPSTPEEVEIALGPPGFYQPGTPERAEAEKAESKMLGFETGATRNRKEDEIRYEGFLSPLAIKMFGEYMHEHRFTADGTVREPDNWQKGIPLDSYMDSLWRHLMDLWMIHRGHPELAREDLKSALAGLFFNVQGYMHETAKKGLDDAD